MKNVKGEKNMKYYSEKLDKLFDAEEALLKAEKEAADKEKEAATKKLKIAAEREKLVSEVDKYNNALDAAYKTYCETKKALSAAKTALKKFDFEHDGDDKKEAISNADSIFDLISDILLL